MAEEPNKRAIGDPPVFIGGMYAQSQPGDPPPAGDPPPEDDNGGTSEVPEGDPPPTGNDPPEGDPPPH